MRFSTIILSVLLIGLSSTDGHPNITFRSDYTYVESTKAFYRFSKTPSDWYNAMVTCTKEGATFFYPENKAEVDIITSLWKQATGSLSSGLHIGISDLGKEGDFVTVDGKPLSSVYHKWEVGQPNGKTNEGAIVLYASGVLHDYPYNQHFYYACKKTLDSLKVNCGDSGKEENKATPMDNETSKQITKLLEIIKTKLPETDKAAQTKLTPFEENLLKDMKERNFTKSDSDNINFFFTLVPLMRNISGTENLSLKKGIFSMFDMFLNENLVID